MDRLITSLSAFNPDIPVYLGKPFASKIRGASGPSALWRDFTTMGFCHGGSGYIMSRELLRRVGPYIREASIPTSLEDAAVASALFEHTGVRCININAKMFGGLDLVGNSHDQPLIQKAVASFERRSPEVLWKTATIHSVTAETTYKLHEMYQRLKGLNLEEKVDKLAERDLEERRWLMATSWNCSVAPMLNNQKPHDAVCMQSALLSEPPFKPRHVPDLDAVWRIVKPGRTCSAADDLDKTRVFGWASFKPDDVATDTYGRAYMPAAGNAYAADSAQRDLIMVVVDTDDDDAIDAFELLLRSLRATGATAEVVVFTTDPTEVAPAAGANCGVTIVEYDAISTRRAMSQWAGMTASDDIMAFGLYEAYLYTFGERYGRVMHVRADTIFQRDPFAAISDNGGVVLFIEDPVITVEDASCFKGVIRVNEVVTRISLSMAFGTSATVMREYYARAVAVPIRMRRCAFEDTVMLQVYRKEMSQFFRVTLLQPWDGPAVFVNPAAYPRYVNGTGANAGRILFVNAKGVVATMATSMLSQMDASTELLAMHPPHARRSPLDIALAELPRRIHGTIRLAAEVPVLPHNVWPPDSKANLRLSGLSGSQRSITPNLVFRPVWELLARYKAFNSNSSQPIVTRIATPTTHKTGAALLSAVLFRFAARHQKRIFHRGEWPFLAPEVLQSPLTEWEGKYDVVFSGLSPKGQWHSEYNVASSFYDHLLGKDHARVLFLQEPEQHYVSWLYYYIIPKKTRFKPMDVVADFVKHRLNRNMLCQEFNLRRIDQLQDFIDDELPRFDIVFVKERLDECLVLMRRRFNWNLLDITYMPFPKSSRRFDGKPLPNVPKVTDLPAATASGINNLIKMDLIFYKAVNRRLDELIAAEGPGFKQEVRLLLWSLISVC